MNTGVVCAVELSGVRWTQRSEPKSKPARIAELSPLLHEISLSATRKLHSANRLEGPAQSSNSLSPLCRREVRLGAVSYQLDGRMRENLSDAGMGSDRTAAVFVAFDGSGATQVP